MNVSAFIIAASVLIALLIVATIVLFIIKKNKGGSSTNGAQGPQGRLGTPGSIGLTGTQGIPGVRGFQGVPTGSQGGSSNADGQLPGLTYNNPSAQISFGNPTPGSIVKSTAYQRINQIVIVSSLVTVFVVQANSVNYSFDMILPGQAPLNNVSSVISFEGLGTPERQEGTATNVDLIRIDVPDTTRVRLNFTLGQAQGSLWNGNGATPSYRCVFTVTYLTTPQ